MMIFYRTRLFLTSAVFLLTLFGTATTANAQSGRLEGTVRDVRTGEPLTGVNIVIDELTIGAASDLNGYFTVINVRPGTYTVKATYIGFTTVTLRDVRININQTTTLDFRLREEVFQGEEVTVVAERPIVQRDVSSSQVNLSAEEIRNLPVTTITGVVGLQAGIQGLSVRGGASDEIAFNVNGLTLRDDRDRSPFTAVSITSVQEVQVQSGGFNAEYGDVQSGIVNVVTKEGRPNRYEFDIYYRHDTPGRKHFGEAINSPNSYWIRPYTDPEVAFTGTSVWDPWTRRQYPAFPGWNQISANTLANANPRLHATPEGAQQVFLWQHRKDMAPSAPDYVLDAGFGGPVPGVSRMLGNMRFWASLRRTQNMYMIPLSRDRYTNDLASLKLTSDVRRGMKLSVEGFYAVEDGTNSNNTGNPGFFSSASGIAGAVVSRNSFGNSRIYSSDYFAPTRVERYMVGGKFTHTLSPRTFYEVIGSYYNTDYSTNPGRLRDTTTIRTFGGFAVDQAPFGFWPLPSTGLGSGLRMGVGMSNSRDSSQLGTLSLRYDLTSQVNRYNQIKTGVQYVQIFSDVNYGSVDIFLPSGRSVTQWNNSPIRAAAYLQNKFEYEGIVANIGMRLDYSNANTEWAVYERFDPIFNEPVPGDIQDAFPTSKASEDLTFSPRLGISFPITVTSKLYFNYGHFQSFPSTFSLYRVEKFTEDSRINSLANPNLPLQKTVSYELGYEQSFLNEYLVRIAGYYKDETNLPITTNFINSQGRTLYRTQFADSYRDTKGLELTLSRPRGTWFSGFVNYTYMIRSTGRFGFAELNQSRKAQRDYEVRVSANAQSKPRPQPYARANVDFFTPKDFGPEVLSLRPFADWRIGFLGSWQAGYYRTWAGGGSIPGLTNNVRWVDAYNLDMRLSRTFRMGGANLNLFIDMNNALNTRYMTQNGFVDGDDYNDYMKSLHLPADRLRRLTGSYLSVPGGDRPGQYRKPGVAYQPIVAVRKLADVTSPHARPLYFNYLDETYYQFRDGSFVEADPKLVKKTLDDKAYIDMPNYGSFVFFNPRNVLVGVRLNF
jgi:outer membrane receptor protein involved in Fe transport